MNGPAPARRSRAGLVAYMAPAAAGWTYLLWIYLDGVCRWGFDRLLERLLPLQIAVAAVAFVGGTWALWLPTRWRRIGVALASLLAAMLLVGVRVVASRPGP